MASDIRYEVNGPVRLITIDRARVMNSLDFEANDRLTELWRRRKCPRGRHNRRWQQGFLRRG